MAALNYEATWDVADDWTYWTNDLAAADITVSRVSAPASPWIGGAGRMRTTWTAGSGLYTYHFSPPGAPANFPARTYRCAFAFFITQLELAGATIGPIRITSRNDAAGSLGETFALTINPSGSAQTLQLTNLLTLAASTRSVDLRRYVGEWLVFDLNVTSTGATHDQYVLNAYCDVWVYRAGRQRFLTRLLLPQSTGASFDFNDLRVGFALLSKGVDAFDLLFDEFRFENGGGLAHLPRSPAMLRQNYGAYARVRRYDKVTGMWKSVLDIDRRAIQSLQLSFLAYRVEDRCEVKVLDPGRYTATKLQDVLDDIDKNPRSLYRLDVYAPDANYGNPQYPSTWPNDFIFWSGVLVRREQDRAQQGRSVVIAATGWTDYLHRIAVTKKIYFKQTVNAMLVDLMTTVASAWPGGPSNIATLTRTGGLDSKLVIPTARFDITNAFDAFGTLAATGNFFFGVAVAGWPSYERQDAHEFRLVFFEPHADLDVTPPTIGLGEENAIFLDVNGDPRVTKCQVLLDDSKYANGWVVSGADLHLDVVSVVTGNDRDEVRDGFAYSNPSGESGAFQFEAGFVGFALTLLDRARREINFTKTETGDVFAAGLLDDLPLNLQVLNGTPTYVIIAFSETSGTVLYTLGNFPASTENLALDLTSDAIRYKLEPGDARALRTVVDAEDQAAREAAVQFLIDARVRGWQLAGTLASANRYAERRNAEQVRLSIRGWQRTPNGSRSQFDNLVSLSFGTERVTLLGTTGNGGDGWKYGDDERPVGCGRTYEIRSVSMTLGEGGWDCEYVLGSAPRDLVAILPPETLSGPLLAGTPQLYQPSLRRFDV